MNDSVIHVLAQLNLQPGQHQRYQVNGRQIEVRCMEEEEKSPFVDMVMLEPWVEFPSGGERCETLIREAPHPLPVPLDIPEDLDDSA